MKRFNANRPLHLNINKIFVRALFQTLGPPLGYPYVFGWQPRRTKNKKLDEVWVLSNGCQLFSHGDDLMNAEKLPRQCKWRRSRTAFFYYYYYYYRWSRASFRRFVLLVLSGCDALVWMNDQSNDSNDGRGWSFAVCPIPAPLPMAWP